MGCQFAFIFSRGLFLKNNIYNSCFFICFCRPGDSPDHERGDGSEDESTGFQPEEHAPRSSADESTLPPKHSQVWVTFI